MKYEKRGFGYVYQKFMRNPAIAVEAKAIFNYLAAFIGDKEECYPGKELMLSELNMSEQRFDKNMKQLTDNGYVIKQRIRNNGKFSHNTYKVNAFPDQNSEMSGEPYHENPSMEKPHLEIQGMDNSGKEKPGMENKGTNINSLNSNSSNSNSKEYTKRLQKHKYGEYQHVLLTDKEEERLISDFGQDQFDKCVTKLDEYIEMKGYKAKNHNLCIRKWVLDAVKKDEETDEAKGGRKAYGETYNTGNCYSQEYYRQFT